MKIPIVILAGGLGTRLKHLSKNKPKALVNVAGKPFIFWQLELLKKQGFDKIFISSGHLGNNIIKDVGDGKKFDLNINHFNDGFNLLGTGGAIKNMIKALPNYFFVMYGDTYLPINFEKVKNYFLRNNKQNTMVILKNDGKWVPSNITVLNNKIIGYSKEKNCTLAKFVDYGVSILSKEIFLKISNNIFDLKLVFNQLINEDKLIPYEVDKRFYEIGTIKSLKETEKYLNNL